MFGGHELDLFGSRGDERPAGQGVGPAEQSPGTLMDGGDGFLGEELLGEAGDLEVVFEVTGHVLELEAFQMRPSDHAGGQGFGGMVEE